MMMELDHSTTKWGASSTPLSSHRPRHFDQLVVSLRRREVYDNNRAAPRRGQPTKSMPLFGFPRCRSFPCMARPSSSSS